MSGMGRGVFYYGVVQFVSDCRVSLNYDVKQSASLLKLCAKFDVKFTNNFYTTILI